MRATIRDIAERVGVSCALISIYLNDRPLASRISEETKRRIDEAVRELNYKASSTARALKSGKSQTLGLVIGDICQSYFGFYAQSLLDECLKHGYQLLLGITRYEPGEERKCLENLFQRQTDGIFHYLGVFPERYIRSAGMERHPILQLASSHPDFNSVLRDEGDALKAGIRRFHELGCRNVFLLHEELECDEGLEAECEKYGMRPYRIPIAHQPKNEEFDRIIRQEPDAILVRSSNNALFLLDSCERLGISRPPALVYGYTLPCDRIDHPSVAGVFGPSFKQLVETTAARMIEMVERPEPEVRHIGVPARFLGRAEMHNLCREQFNDPFYSPLLLRTGRS